MTRGSNNSSVGNLSVWRALGERRLRGVTTALVAAGIACGVATGFARVRELFPGAHAIGVLALGIGVGYIASWTLYYLAVWRPETETRDRAMLEASIAAVQLAGTATGLVHDLMTAAGDEPRSLTRSEIADLCRRLTLSTPAPLVSLPDYQVQLPVRDLFQHYFARARGFAEKIERWQAVVDTEFVQLVYRLLDCGLVKQIAPMMASLNPTQDLAWLTQQLTEFCDQAIALRRWLVQNATIYLVARSYDLDALRSSEPLLD